MITLPGRRFGAEHPKDVLSLARLLNTVFGLRAREVVRCAERAQLSGIDSAQRMWGRSVEQALRLEISTSGLEHVGGGPYMVVALHEGFADVLPLLRLPLSLSWAARDELIEWPRLGRYLASGAAVTFAPERPIEAYRRLRAESSRVFRSGRSLVVYPQGTLLGIETGFKRGAFRIADSLGVPVLPVVVTGGARVYEYPFSPLVRFDQKMSMRVLPALPAGGSEATVGPLQREMKQVAFDQDPGPRRYVPNRDGFWDGYAFDIDDDFASVKAEVELHRRDVRRTLTSVDSVSL